MCFGKRLRLFRQKAGYRTAKDFAEKLGLPYSTYVAYENTDREPKYKNLKRICQLLNISPGDLLIVDPLKFKQERLREIDTKQKRQVLDLLTMALNAADGHVSLEYDEQHEVVLIDFLVSQKPRMVVNVNLDNPMAMMYDIFKVAGRAFIEEA